MYLNKAIVYGNLTRDPELKSLPSGIKVTNFSLATNRVFKDRDGNKKEQADFHNIVVFGVQAENVAKYLKKGNTAMVEGRMQTRSWDGQDGVKKYRTEIIAERVQFGPKGGGASTRPAQDSPSQEAPKQEDSNTIEYPEEEINAEDIPF